MTRAKARPSGSPTAISVIEAAGAGSRAASLRFQPRAYSVPDFEKAVEVWQQYRRAWLLYVSMVFSESSGSKQSTGSQLMALCDVLEGNGTFVEASRSRASAQLRWFLAGRAPE